MCEIPPMTWLFLLLGFLTVGAALFVRHFWKNAQAGLRWTSRDSRNVYVDCAKTLITASGITVTLLAASGSTLARTPIVMISVKVAVVCLILCVVFSMGVMLALVRCHELANSRWMEQERNAGRSANVQIPQGELTNTELGWILFFTFFALTTFLWGLVFLGIIGWHL
jgi:hypothetical protein